MTKLGKLVATLLAVFAALYIIGHCAGCSAAQNRAVAADALTGSQLLCVLATALSDSAEVATACKIDQALVPLIQPLMAQKAAMRARCAPRTLNFANDNDAGRP